jgi:hypothetical protein
MIDYIPASPLPCEIMDITIPKLTDPVAAPVVKGKRGRPSKIDVAKREEDEVRSLQYIDAFPDQTDAQRIARILERFDIMWRLTRGVVNGIHKSLIISGAAGVGKSYNVTDLLSQAASGDGQHGLAQITYDVFSGSKMTNLSMFIALYQNRHKNAVTLIDDSDSIYESEDTLNLLKSALEDKPVRRLRHPTQAPVLKSMGIDETGFDYEGSMIFITNKNMQAMIDAGKNRMVPHFKALQSRSIYMDLQLHSIPDLVVWVDYMITKKQILQQKFGITPSQETEALDWIKANARNLRELSIRTAEHIAKFMLNDYARWEQFARVTLLR